MVDRSASTRGVRQSLVGQEPGDPRVADLLARAVGFVESKVRVDEVGDSRQEAVAVRASPGPLAPRSPGRRKGNRCIPDRAAVPGGPDPIVSPEAVARTFRRRDEAELQSDLVALIGRRTDLAAVQCAELFRASIVRLQERYRIKERIPSATAIGAWVDAVVPPDPGAAIPPAVGSVPYTPDPKAIALLTDSGSEAIARSLLALAGRRPDLSDLQRHELFLAGLVHLVVRKAGLIIAPKRPRIFEWIDLVAPFRRPPSNTAGTGAVEDHPAAADDAAGRPGLLGTRAPSSSEQAAAQLEDSARRGVARWVGDPRVTSLIATLRPMFRERLDELGLEDPDGRAEAALRILGISAALPDGTEVPNLFATWPEERLGPARFTASAIRAAIDVFVARLRDEHGVTAIAPVEKIPPDEGTPDGLHFRGDHSALLQLLWLDISIEGRTGSEIAADVPVVGTVGWDRDGSTLLVGGGDVASPDIVAGDILRRAFLERVEATVDAARSDAASTLQPSAALSDVFEANPPELTDVDPRDGRRRRRKPRPGRPRGTRYLTGPLVFRANRDLDADAAAERLKMRDGRVRRYVTLQDLADKLDAPLATLRDFLRSKRLNWRDRSDWPPE